MRRLVITAFALLAALPLDAQAQANAIVVYCETCRDPHTYPDDYANFAFNQIYGSSGWMNPEQADDFYIENAAGQRVYVDVDFVMHGAEIFGINLPIWPDNLLSIRLVLPNGLIIEVIRSIFMSPLPVPATPDQPGGGPAPVGGSEDGEEGVDEPEGDVGDDPELDDYEPEFVGSTGVQDPDEDGDFPEPDWCQEC